ncbi:TonB-dependent receptor [Alteromonas oceanisediminis]|uniref:TonB-dependent receptor n=1 Tax=Alteromonas oceanisediminis TaxID=2836180 RepID=UPI001BD9A4EA|nr:TonB-dependent receptor [Alteromonas oceanisediminis]MBT0586793.1 TonB-dependent receptor [Alteromonas oceanisediminis]
MNNNNLSKAKYSALTIAVLSALSMPAALAQETPSDEQNIEKIEVRGFAASQRENLNEKRFSDNVVDVISAEDLGKFPDKNIGEALRRLPGIALNSRFGEGESVSIRGLSPSLSLTTLNGQTLAAAQWFEGNAPSRGFPVDLLAAELVSSLSVFKSPQANIDEGSIGGSIDIETRKPLDLDANAFFATAEVQYSELAEEFDPQLSGLYSWKTEDETFGILVNVSSQKRTTNRENMENYLSAPTTVLDGSSDATSATWGAGSALFQQEREREAYNVTMQYQPMDELEFTLSYLRFEMEANNLNSNYLTIPGRIDGIRNVTEQTSGGLALKHDINVADAEYFFGPDTFFRQSKPTNDIIDLGMVYEQDTYTVKARLGKTSADNDIYIWGLSGKVGAEHIETGQVSPDATQTLDLTGGRLQQSFTNFDPADPASYPAVANGARLRVEETDETFAQLDAIFNTDISMGWVDVHAIHVGGKYKSHEKSLDQYQFADEWAQLFDTLNVETYADLPTTVESGLFSEQAGPNSLTTLPIFNMGDILAFGGSSIPNDVKAASRQDRGAFYLIEEDILAAYVMAEFSGENFRGNLGLRYVDTQLDSTGWLQENGAFTTIGTENGDYAEVLPSFNLAYNINEDLIFRGALSKVIARPDYGQLAGGLSIIEEFRTGSGGNPNLEPWKANQLDAGLEWYFDSASLLSATYFFKDIDSYIFVTSSQENVPGFDQPFEITRPRNGGSADLSGIEFSFQTEFGYGFGIVANYTYTDAKVEQIDGEEGFLPGNSETMWNVTPYWENDMFEARVMVNHRGKYFEGFNRGSANFIDDFTSVDVAFTYHVNDHIDINLQGLNVTNELWTARHSQDAFDGTWRQLAENGARWFAGVNIRY